jgi:phosphatidylglycerophosphatase A
MKMKSWELKGSTPVRKMAILLATGFGLGLSPFASGTFGAVIGVVMVLGLQLRDVLAQSAFAISLAVLCVPICDIAERHFGTKDDGRIVADEYMTFPLCVIGLPYWDYPWLLLIAFLTHRILDIIKPFPAYRLQDIGGGKGIVVDDVISSLYALALNHAIFWGIREWLMVNG